MSCICCFIFFILVIPEWGGGGGTSFEVLGSVRGDFYPAGGLLQGAFFFFLIDAPKAVSQNYCNFAPNTNVCLIFPVYCENINPWSGLACMELLLPLHILITDS